MIDVILLKAAVFILDEFIKCDLPTVFFLYAY